MSVLSDPGPHPDDLNAMSRTILRSAQGLWQLQLRRPVLGRHQRVDINRIWLQDAENEGLWQTSFNALAHINSTVNWDEATISILGLADDQIHVVEIGSADEISTSPFHIRIEGTPRRILYLSQHQKLLVGYDKHHVSDSGSASQKPATPVKRYLFSHLMILDPHGIDPNHPEAFRSRLTIGDSGERIFGMTNWKIELDGKKWDTIVTCTSNKKHGRIGIYSLVGPSNEVQLYPKVEYPTPEPVFAITPYDASTICFCEGRDLKITTRTEEDGSLKFRPQPVDRLRSPAMHLTARPPFVCASTQNESFTAIQVRDQQSSNAIRLNSPESRNGSTHLELPEHSLILAADSDGRVDGLWHAPHDTENVTLPKLFQWKSSSHVRGFWTEPLPERSRSREDSPITSRMAAVLIKDDIRAELYQPITASAFDGSFYRIDILDEPRWRLLKFVQNLADQHPAICPHSYAAFQYYNRNTEPDGEHPDARHIDGDILARILEGTGCGHAVATLREVIGGEWPEPSSNQGLREPKERVQRFIELAHEVLGPGDDKMVFEMVVDFMREIIKPTALP